LSGAENGVERAEISWSGAERSGAWSGCGNRKWWSGSGARSGSSRSGWISRLQPAPT